MTFAWNEQTETRLRDLWQRGDTAREIANQLGCSRNAVLGKKMRLGLEEREGGGAAAARAVRGVRLSPEERMERARVSRAKWRERHPEKVRVERDRHNERRRAHRSPTPVRVVARNGRLVEPLNLPFTELDKNGCRYPTIETAGQQFWCGRPQDHGTSYCSDCARLAFTEEGYERLISKAAKLRQPAGGQVHIAAPFSNRDYNVVGLVREVPFS